MVADILAVWLAYDAGKVQSSHQLHSIQTTCWTLASHFVKFHETPCVYRETLGLPSLSETFSCSNVFHTGPMSHDLRILRIELAVHGEALLTLLQVWTCEAAKRRSGERDDKYWQISPDKCPEFIELQTDSDFIGILDLGIRKTWSGIRPSNTFSRDAQRHGRTSKHDKLAQQHTATTNTRSSCGVRAPVSKPMIRILTGCGPHIRVFLRVLFLCTASEFSTGPLGSQQFQALIVTWQRDSSSQGQWILPVIDRCAWDRMGPNGTEWDRIWLCCIQVTAGDSILLGHKPWAKMSLRDVEWNIVAVRNISYSTVFALASEKVLCIASRALNFCCALHAKNSLDQLWAWHVAWLELVKLL